MIGLKTEGRREIADEFGSFLLLHQVLLCQTVVSGFLLPVGLYMLTSCTLK